MIGAQSIGQQIAIGAGWIILLRFAVRILGIASTIILARLLHPSDYGLIALASVISGGIQLLSAFNFDIWLVRRKQTLPEHYDTVWTLSILRGILTAILIAALAVPAGNFFEDARLAHVLLLLALSSVVLGFQNVGIIDFQRNLEFDREFRLFAWVKFGSFIVTVIMALLLKSYVALLSGIISGSLLQLYLSFRLHCYRPRLSLVHAREVFEFSKWLLLGNVFGFLYTRSHVFILGKLAGMHVLGFYNVAQEFSNLASTELLMPLRRVLLPAYSKMTDDFGELRRSFIETFTLILLIGLPIAIGISLVADPLIGLLLGDRWLEAIPLLKILVVYAIASICIANQGPLLIALGETRLLSNLYGLGVMLQIPAVLIAIEYSGVIGVAWAVSSIHMLIFLISIWKTLNRIELSVKQFVGEVWRVVASTALMATCVWQISILAQEYAFSHAIKLLIMVPAGILIYGLSVVLLWWVVQQPSCYQGRVVMMGAVVIP